MKDEEACVASPLPPDFTLPARIAALYKTASCLRNDQDQQIYLLNSLEGGGPMVLKRDARPPATSLALEYKLMISQNFRFLPRAAAYFEADGAQYLLREYVPGKTLYRRVSINGPLSPTEAGSVVRDLLVQIEALHKHGIRSIDLSPQNIVCTPAGELVLVDMSAAQESALAGQSDATADLYALGLLFAYLLTGHADPNALAGVPRRLKRIIRKCTADKPEKRYVSACALQNALSMRRLGRVMDILSKVLLILLLACLHFPLTAVQFESPQIEHLVRDQLGKRLHEPIYKSELSQITQILLCGDQVFSDWESHLVYCGMHTLQGRPIKGSGSIEILEDLRMMPALNTLVLDNQHISDLLPLAGLPLKRVSLCGNAVRDITPFRACSKIEELFLADNALECIEGIQHLTGLQILSLADNYLIHLSALQELSALRSLDISGSLAFGIDSLGNLPALEEVTCDVDQATQMRSVYKDLPFRMTLRQPGEYPS